MTNIYVTLLGLGAKRSQVGAYWFHNLHCPCHCWRCWCRSLLLSKSPEPNPVPPSAGLTSPAPVSGTVDDGGPGGFCGGYPVSLSSPSILSLVRYDDAGLAGNVPCSDNSDNLAVVGLYGTLSLSLPVAWVLPLLMLGVCFQAAGIVGLLAIL